MKICAIICEYNPFHNGHLYQLREAKARTNADALLCVMSGNFVQRGEAAIVDKFTRARHAVLAGADVVLELPTVFATSNAELFANGAIRLLSSIPDVKTLCFGAESADKTAFKLAARYLSNEPQEVSETIKREIANGASYAKARAKAWAGFIPFDLLSSPNNILGLEYTKAILTQNTDIEILPIQRTGAGYSETDLREEYSSATAIRAAIEKGDGIKNQLPPFVFDDLPKRLETCLETLEKYALLATEKARIARVCDCTEGLENAFKRTAEENLPLVETLTSARYTSSRIRRIALQNLLSIEESLIRAALSDTLYLRVLAVKKERQDVLSALGESAFPLLVRTADASRLEGVARAVYEKDLFADQIHALLYERTRKREIFI
ncbi:MAG: nucleotidyltransferase family protein [Clostridia bacterium]|nr:nucleotidyltransferase family protein [Clostridia bacterium]